MKRRRVDLHEDAENDLLALYNWVAEKSGHQTAISYIDRIEDYCRGFDVAPERGQPRDDVMPGLRIIGFEKKATIAFVVEAERVLILRVFYGGQDWKEKI